ncbi:serine--tRNA ligase-like [Lineus longissimus]|uniref:serine--tRNA ligase-like n=1 Tax=Lineus longissimus TaxID=88925 RepID=UPI00315D04D3
MCFTTNPLLCRMSRNIYQTLRNIRRCSYKKNKIGVGHVLTRLQERNLECFPRNVSHRHYSSSRELSALFISPADEHNTSMVELDLDLDSRLENLDMLQDNLLRRGMVRFNLDEWVMDYKHYKRLKKEVEAVQEERKQVSRQMGDIVRQKSSSLSEEKGRLIKRGKELKLELRQLTKPFWEIEEEVILKGLSLPNKLHPAVPLSEDMVLDDPRIAPKPTVPLPRKGSILKRLQERDLLEFSPIGPTAYYMKGDLAILEQAISRYTQGCLESEGISGVVCPDIVKAFVVEGCGVDVTNPDKVFRLQSREEETDRSSDPASGNKSGNTLFLTGSSHYGMVASLVRMMVNEISLPIKCYTLGRSYSPVKEDGDDENLLAVSQATEFHLFTSCKSKSQAEEMFALYQDVLLKMYRPFNLNMRFLNVGAKNLHGSESRRIDVECWVPSVESFIKLASISSCDDYFSRRLMMQCSRNMTSSPHKYQHIVHGSALVMPRFITALLENLPSRNEQVVIPDVLRSHWIGPLPHGTFTFADS